ncbi:glycerophosphodiester phosphodiesterase family protein [Maricaulis sp. D1M11]|uniref:glycerophosphodiester phosphodiesterase family protein n=1 Tax=Maricaulis sp. D1M11 TaxID=3076117 RepID=UPI0039B692D1
MKTIAILSLTGSIAAMAIAGVTHAEGNAAADRIVCRADLVAQSMTDHETRRVLVAAHRGAHLTVPENSLASIDRAVELGVDIVELDVRLTADGVPVLMHDSTLDRTTTGQGRLDEWMFDDLQRLRLLMPDGQVSDMTIPTLDQALGRAADRVIVDIDLKVSELAPVLASVERHSHLDQVLFYHGDLEVLAQLRQLQPGVQIMPLARTLAAAQDYSDRFEIEVIHLRDSYANADLARALDQRNSSNWLNALGRVDEFLAQGSQTALDRLLAAEVDIIQTDQPERTLAILDAKGLRPDFLGLDGQSPCLIVRAAH